MKEVLLEINNLIKKGDWVTVIAPRMAEYHSNQIFSSFHQYSIGDVLEVREIGNMDTDVKGSYNFRCYRQGTRERGDYQYLYWWEFDLIMTDSNRIEEFNNLRNALKLVCI